MPAKTRDAPNMGDTCLRVTVMFNETLIISSNKIC